MSIKNPNLQPLVPVLTAVDTLPSRGSMRDRGVFVSAGVPNEAWKPLQALSFSGVPASSRISLTATQGMLMKCYEATGASREATECSGLLETLLKNVKFRTVLPPPKAHLCSRVEDAPSDSSSGEDEEPSGKRLRTVEFSDIPLRNRRQTSDRRYLMERNVSLSQSVVWYMQLAFYASLGTSAWGDDGQVPFEITSNGYIAHAYAAAMLPVLSEALATGHTAYVLELGAGHGKFGFMFLKQLQELWKTARGDGSEWPPIKYIMSDFTSRNVDVWKLHPTLAPLVDAGVLDFSVLDALECDEIKLDVAGKVLKPGSVRHLTVVANYLVDTLPADAFKVTEEGHLLEGLVTTHMSPATGPVPLNDCAINSTSLERSESKYTWRRVRPNKGHYRSKAKPPASAVAWDEYLDEVRCSVKKSGKCRAFVFPTGGIEALENLERFCAKDDPHKTFQLIISDKGYTDMDTFIELGDGDDPYLAKHGSVSLCVYFDAFRDHFQRRGGFSITPTPSRRHNSVQTCIFGCAGPRIESLVRTACRGMHGFLPDEYYSFVDRWGPVLTARDRVSIAPFSEEAGYATTAYRSLDTTESIEEAVALVRLSGFDSSVFLNVAYSLQRRSHPGLPSDTIDALQEVIERVADQWYMVSPYDERDAATECARLAQRIGKYQLALSLATKSLKLRSNVAKLFTELGYKTPGTSSQQARTMFVKAVSLASSGNLTGALTVAELAAAISAEYMPLRNTLRRQVEDANPSPSPAAEGTTDTSNLEPKKSPIVTPAPSPSLEDLREKLVCMRKRLSSVASSGLSPMEAFEESRSLLREITKINLAIADLGE